MKTIKKNWWMFLFLILSIIAFAVNLLLAIKFTNSSYANIFTAISGWISGIATIILGIITYRQSRKYTVLSLKSELKNEIRLEKEKLIELFNNTCTYSKMTECLSLLVLPSTPTSLLTNQLSYKMKIDELTERLTEAAGQMQMFRYNAQQIPEAVKKFNEMTLYVYDKYKTAADLAKKRCRIIK